MTALPTPLQWSLHSPVACLPKHAAVPHSPGLVFPARGERLQGWACRPPVLSVWAKGFLVLLEDVNKTTWKFSPGLWLILLGGHFP